MNFLDTFRFANQALISWPYYETVLRIYLIHMGQH
jgi:hypothetical protein